jgi:transcriptional regulator with XRE-family HTH domain
MEDVLDLQQVAKDLAALRDSRGYSQRAFAKEIGLSYSTVQAIESGKVRIWLDDFEKWLEACGTTLLQYVSKSAVSKDYIELQKDVQIFHLFERAIQVPAKREQLNLYLQSLTSGAASPKGRGPSSRGKGRDDDQR